MLRNCQYSAMAASLSVLNKALNRIPKRAEQRHADQLRATFVDSGVSALLEAPDHQVLYGRRGTGKTHAMRYLEGHVNGIGSLAIYVDLRTVGSADGLFGGPAALPTERAGKLVVDLLGQVHDSLIAFAVENDDLIADTAFISKLDALAIAITTVRIGGDVEVEQQGEQSSSRSRSATLSASLSKSPSIGLTAGAVSGETSREVLREVRRGPETVSLNFSEVARALRDLATALGVRRVWILLDEWTSLPADIQPYVGEFLVRCVLPLQQITVKIAAIEQQSSFRARLDDGQTIGVELGADVTANVDLDEFMVFEQDEERSRAFFQGLFFKHLTSGLEPDDTPLDIASEQQFISIGFTDKRAFDELLRASEGVPRDAINILGKAAFKAGDSKISVPDIRTSARAWYLSDKEAAVRSNEEATALLNWIIDQVIRGKRARGFLVNQSDAETPLLLGLFDARVLHIVRRGYSAQDSPGERFDVWVIDYGAYIDMMHTKNEPQGLLPLDGDIGDSGEDGWVDVPPQDLRAIRRAVLDLGEFRRRGDTPIAQAGLTAAPSERDADQEP